MKCADADFVVEREKGGGAVGGRSERGGEGPAVFEVARPHVQVIEGLGAGIEIEPMRGQGCANAVQPLAGGAGGRA